MPAAATLPATCPYRRRGATAALPAVVLALITSRCRRAAKLAAADALSPSPPLPHYCRRRAIAAAALLPPPLTTILTFATANIYNSNSVNYK